ncbi:MAG: phospholipase C, phosphocholine-specific, partial [Bacteroidota bacterium]|nr:phospholipase C, phosphocholine-specific [Bacteroidota bacterium]
MDSRREFLKKVSLLSGGAALLNVFPPSIQQAFAINPASGTTWQDAEHIVFLMQENRSFDHCFGSLQGVRGFNDPRAITLPNQHPVWLQTAANGQTYAPFRLDMNNTKATWMGGLSHSWSDQLDARNEGKYDRWLIAKEYGSDELTNFPMTMGYYTREDVPFYYALADAFTVCDQHFCSALTGTTPNRLYFWSGAIREDANAKARVWNGDTDYDRNAGWATYPE